MCLCFLYLQNGPFRISRTSTQVDRNQMVLAKLLVGTFWYTLRMPLIWILQPESITTS